MVIMSAIGGETVTTTIEGRERYTRQRPLRPRAARRPRQAAPRPRPDDVRRAGPLAQLADIQLDTGPAMIRDENGMLAGYVYVDVTGRDIGGYVEEAKKIVAREAASSRPGYSAPVERPVREHAAGERAAQGRRPADALPHLRPALHQHQSAVKAGIVLLAVPFSLIGAVWFLYILGYNISIAVWVGIIALLGLDAETGVFMLLFLDLAYDDRVRQGRMKTFEDLKEAIIHGAVKRIRPKMMTVTAIVHRASSHHVVHRDRRRT